MHHTSVLFFPGDEITNPWGGERVFEKTHSVNPRILTAKCGEFFLATNIKRD
jgi:hypothetical protein